MLDNWLVQGLIQNTVWAILVLATGYLVAKMSTKSHNYATNALYGLAAAVLMLFLIVQGKALYYSDRPSQQLTTDTIDSLEKENGKFKEEINALKAATTKELPPPPVHDYKKFPSDKFEQVFRRTFINETVELDGKFFEECTFSNVTFVYQGLGPTRIINARWLGSTGLSSDNASIKTWANLSNYIRHLKGVEVVIEGEKDATGTFRTVTKDFMMPPSKEANKKEDTSTKKQNSK